MLGSDHSRRRSRTDVDNELPLGRGHKLGELVTKLRHDFWVLGTVVTRVQNADDAANVRARDGDADNGLDAPLLSSSASLKVVGGCVVNALLPGGDTTLIHATRKATTNIKRELLAVVSKGLEIEALLGS
jgi:hypothetical protein